MKLKNLKKIMSILILIILVNCAVPLISRATDNLLVRTSEDESKVNSPTISGFSDWQQQAKDFIKEGNKDAKISTSDAIKAFVPIGKILVGVGTIVLVVVGLIFGVKYMMSGADDRARAKTKTYLLCYFSITNIWCSRNILYSNKNFE